MAALPRPIANSFAAADYEYATITSFLGSKDAHALNHSDLERQLEGMGRELMRQLLQAHLDLRQPGDAVAPVRDADGVARAPTPVQERTLETIFGTVTVALTGYRADGTTSLHPLDGELNLPREKYSLEVRRRVAIEAAKSAFDEGVKTLEAFTGAHVPKRQFEQLVVRAAQDFDAFYTHRQTRARADPHTGPILVLTVDGKGVVMRPEDLRDATRHAAATRADTFTARLGPGRRPPRQAHRLGRGHLYRRAVRAHARGDPAAAGDDGRAAGPPAARTQTRLGQPRTPGRGRHHGDV
jgi:hypothetical protein